MKPSAFARFERVPPDMMAQARADLTEHRLGWPDERGEPSNEIFTALTDVFSAEQVEAVRAIIRDEARRAAHRSRASGRRRSFERLLAVAPDLVSYLDQTAATEAASE